jgi:hypothetical protein
MQTENAKPRVAGGRAANRGAEKWTHNGSFDADPASGFTQNEKDGAEDQNRSPA